MDIIYELDKINSLKTKEAMREVLSSYQNKNYRSAVNSLYSAVILDLMEKIRTLAVLDNDEAAKKIFDKVQEDQIKHPEDSKWELDVLEWTFKRKNFVSKLLQVNIECLKKFRNLSSHPSIKEDQVELFAPDQQVVAGLINSITTSLFSQSPNLMGNVINIITDDLARQDLSSPLFDKQLKNLLNVYINELNEKQLTDVITTLFQFVFCKESDAYREHRKVTYLALLILIDYNQGTFLKSLKGSKDTLHKIVFSKETKPYLIQFICKYPSFINSLDAQLKENLQLDVRTSYANLLLYPQVIGKQQDEIVNLAIDWMSHDVDFFENGDKVTLKLDFPGNEVQEHNFPDNELIPLKESLYNLGKTSLFVKFILTYFVTSNHYSHSEYRSGALARVINDCTEKDLYFLLEKSNSNSQIYDGYDAARYIRNTIFDLYVQKKGLNTQSKNALKISLPNLFKK